MSNFNLDALNYRVGSSFDTYDTINRPLTVYIAPRGTVWNDILTQYAPDSTVATFAEALAKLNAYTGSNTNPIPATIVFCGGTHNTSTGFVVPSTLAGCTVYADPSANFVATADLGAGNHVLTIAANKVTVNLNNAYFNTTAATQNGGALALGGASNAVGTADDARVSGLYAGSLGAGDDFTQTLLVRGSDRVIVRDSIIQTTAVPAVQVSANSSSNNCNRTHLINVQVTTKSNARPLLVDATQADGFIIGGRYINQGTNSAAIITGDNWTLDGGVLFANQTAVGNNAQVDLQTATNINIGQVFVKQITGNTPATLLDQTNV